MKTRKRKTRLKVKKLLCFLFMVFACLALLVFGVVKGVEMWHSASAEEGGKPTYYLFIGSETAGSEADSLLLTAINEKKKELTFISLPPNTEISKHDAESMLLKQTFADGGAEETKSSVENLLHIRIDKYAVIRYDDFEALMDKAGRLDMYVEKSMDHTDADGNIDIHLRQGYQSMDAAGALSYLRYVDQENGELGRIQRQERFLKMLLYKLQNHMALYNWAMAKRAWCASETDISSSEAASLAYGLTDFPKENCRFVIIPGEMHKSEKTSRWVVNPVEAQKALALTME